MATLVYITAEICPFEAIGLPGGPDVDAIIKDIVASMHEKFDDNPSYEFITIPGEELLRQSTSYGIKDPDTVFVQAVIGVAFKGIADDQAVLDLASQFTMDPYNIVATLTEPEVPKPRESEAVTKAVEAAILSAATPRSAPAPLSKVPSAAPAVTGWAPAAPAAQPAPPVEIEPEETKPIVAARWG
ncbi:Uncharacterised protein [Mycobacteroides abscessus subsp. abscessus]|uniref:hypothetical protein n=1 Tax=Mycobacteroides abscessus TaxID=36809 RepID=UPI000929D4BA|nr:hypothetical protein [Mycobacteroides abscessus]SIH21309.1 Uncharacterised protein [Mycobacteroides abscessus subsp. abscessus]